VDHLFTVNQVASVLNLVQSHLHILVPVFQSIVSELLLVVERNNTLKSVDFRRDALAHHHVADFSLSSLTAHTHQLSKLEKTNAAVVLLNYTNIVLNQLLHKFANVALVVFS
jgi:hypothetical protein